MNQEEYAKELLKTGQPMHAQAAALIGILEELKTTNHILASAYAELKVFLYPETPQPEIKLVDVQEVVYYVLRRPVRHSSGWISYHEYRIMDCLQGDDDTRPCTNWDIISDAFDTWADAVRYMDTFRTQTPQPETPGRPEPSLGDIEI